MARSCGTERTDRRRLALALGTAALVLSGAAVPFANAAGGEMPGMSVPYPTADHDAVTKAALEPNEVTIRNFSFAPRNLTVAPGTKVVWTNNDESPHTVVSSDEPRLFKSLPLDTNDAFAFVFDKPGTYHYFCSVHPMMQGTIVVK